MVCVCTGLVWQGCKKMYTERLKVFAESWYNITDVLMLVLYITSFVLRYFSRIKVST